MRIKFLMPVILLAVAITGGTLLTGSSASALRNTSYSHCGSVIGSGYFVTSTSSTRYPGVYYSTQRQGNSNSCVRDIQVALNTACTNSTKLATDGIYGTKTARAVKNFQRFWANGPFGQVTSVNGSPIIIDGVVGPQTWVLLTTKYNEIVHILNCAA